MLETLLLVPSEIAGVPVFGIGLGLGLLLIALVVRIVMVSRDASLSWGNWLASEGFLWAVAAVVLWKVVPMVCLKNVDGEPVGLAIRGYGVFLLCGVVSGIWLASYRAKKFQLDPGVIYSVAPWAFFGGIFGARLFYVIQYRENFQTIGDILNFTQGGLVVYGSFIGGGLAVWFYVWRNKISALRMGDVIVPCLFLGLFFGRIGCLMHGCCWGGRCDAGQIGALEFPPGSPVYRDQLEDGTLLGFSYDPKTFKITTVKPDSLAYRAGLREGQQIDDFVIDRSSYASASRDVAAETIPIGLIVSADSKRYRFTAETLPSRALPVFPAQILGSICGLLLCVSLSTIPFGRFREGMIMLIGFSGYAVMRFIMEIIRVDEAGQFGTNLTISQWVSVLVLIGSILGFIALRAKGTPKPAANGPQIQT
jgi:phosphatidylglycerol---prolipoprotein diacylglyceryl transferase